MVRSRVLVQKLIKNMSSFSFTATHFLPHILSNDAAPPACMRLHQGSVNARDCHRPSQEPCSMCVCLVCLVCVPGNGNKVQKLTNHVHPELLVISTSASSCQPRRIPATLFRSTFTNSLASLPRHPAFYQYRRASGGFDYASRVPSPLTTYDHCRIPARLPWINHQPV